jgi:hypothetical protein
MLIFAALSFCCSASTLAHNLLPTTHEKFCHTNASTYTLKNSGYSRCVVQAVILFYCIYACCATWLMKTFDMFLKVFFHYEEINLISVAMHIFVIFLLPIIPTAITGHAGYFGADYGTPWCFVLQGQISENYSFNVFYIPILIITIIGGLLTVISIIGLIVHVNNGNRSLRFSESQKNNSIKFVNIDPYMITTLCFNFSMIIIWLTFVISAFQNKANKQDYNDSAKEWTKCYFLNYANGITDLESICGELPKKHPSFNELKWVMFCFTGQLIVLGFTYLICSLVRYFVFDTFEYTKPKTEEDFVPAEVVYIDKNAIVETQTNISTSVSAKLEVELV